MPSEWNYYRVFFNDLTYESYYAQSLAAALEEALNELSRFNSSTKPANHHSATGPKIITAVRQVITVMVDGQETDDLL